MMVKHDHPAGPRTQGASKEMHESKQCWEKPQLEGCKGEGGKSFVAKRPKDQHCFYSSSTKTNNCKEK